MTTTTRGGWHHRSVTFTDHTTGIRHTWAITWRTQDVQCAGHYARNRPDWDRVVRWDAEHPPIAGGDERGEPQAAVAQCRQCGRLVEGRFVARQSH